jgi:hypothetical protein
MRKMRAKQQAALDKRFASQVKKKSTTIATSVQPAVASKNPSALEQMSKENLAWRNADAQVDVLRWE